MQQAARAIKRACPEIVVILDSCFDEYTTHGTGVVMRAAGPMSITTRRWKTWAGGDFAGQGGADMVAPSGMMDGVVGGVPRGAG